MEDNYNSFIDALTKELNGKSNIIFLCIGTDRVIGDCIGPVTGSLLESRFGKEYVYGNLDNNLTFENINNVIEEINFKHTAPYIVAIDAALSSDKNIGKFFVDYEGINFGEGLDKNRCRVGNLGIKVVVGKDYNDSELNFRALQNASLKDVIVMSKKIYDGITSVVKK